MNLKQTDPEKTRRFGIGLSVALVIIGTVQLLKQWPVVSLCFFAAACSAFLLALRAPGVLRPLQWLLTRIARAIGWFNTRLLLGIMFYLIFAPLGLVMRVLGKDPLEKGMNEGLESYWIKREMTTDDISRYEKQF